MCVQCASVHVFLKNVSLLPLVTQTIEIERERKVKPLSVMYIYSFNAVRVCVCILMIKHWLVFQL